MNINPSPSILDGIEIASPCSASWEDMKGDDRVRDRSQCQLSVYNISELSKKNAESLIGAHEGRLCIRLYRRADGTVITDNCPVALRKIRNSLKNVARTAAAVLSFVLSLSFVRAGNENVTKVNSSESSKAATGKKQQSATSEGRVLQGEPDPKSSDSPGVKMGQMKVSPRPGKVLQGKPILSTPKTPESADLQLKNKDATAKAVHSVERKNPSIAE